MAKKTPRYLQIAQDIINQIQMGSLQSGDQIMTESQLCDIYHVSRMTVNKALSTLVEKGHIRRIAGKGSFILEHQIIKLIGSTESFSNDIRSINKTPGAILLEYQVLRASCVGVAAEKLQLMPEELVHHFSRIRTSDKIPVALSHTYVPCKYLPALDVAVLEHSFYAYLDKTYGLHPLVRDCSFNAELPNEQQKKLLHTDSCALLKVCHTSLAENIDLFEYTETYYVGNRYTYRFQAK